MRQSTTANIPGAPFTRLDGASVEGGIVFREPSETVKRSEVTQVKYSFKEQSGKPCRKIGSRLANGALVLL
jgi:hypothetical protein